MARRTKEAKSADFDLYICDAAYVWCQKDNESAYYRAIGAIETAEILGHLTHTQASDMRRRLYVASKGYTAILDAVLASRNIGRKESHV